MARYHAQFTSATAAGVDVIVGSLVPPAAVGFNLRRVTGGLITVGSASAPPDQNCALGIANITAAGTGAATASSTTGVQLKMNQNTAAPAVAANLSYATTQPTIGAAATDPYVIPCSSRGGFDVYWEGVEEWQVLFGVTGGLAFVNRRNALTSPLAWDITVEWEE